MQKTRKKRRQEKIDYQSGNFTIIHNSILHAEIDGKRISLEAIGLYSEMKSKPPNWQFSERKIASRLNIGNKKVGRILRELEFFGLLERKQKIKPNKDFATIEYILKDIFEPALNNENIYNSRAVVLGARETTAPIKDYNNVKKIDKLNDKGLLDKPQDYNKDNHFLTIELIDNKIVSRLDREIEKFNNLFIELDNNYDYKLILTATRYLIDNLKKDKKYKKLDSKYAYFKTSIYNNLEMLSNRNNKNERPKNLPKYVLEYLKELEQFKAVNEE